MFAKFAFMLLLFLKAYEKEKENFTIFYRKNLAFIIILQISLK